MLGKNLSSHGRIEPMTSALLSAETPAKFLGWMNSQYKPGMTEWLAEEGKQNSMTDILIEMDAAYFRGASGEINKKLVWAKQQYLKLCAEYSRTCLNTSR